MSSMKLPSKRTTEYHQRIDDIRLRDSLSDLQRVKRTQQKTVVQELIPGERLSCISQYQSSDDLVSQIDGDLSNMNEASPALYPLHRTPSRNAAAKYCD